MIDLFLQQTVVTEFRMMLWEEIMVCKKPNQTKTKTKPKNKRTFRSWADLWEICEGLEESRSKLEPRVLPLMLGN